MAMTVDNLEITYLALHTADWMQTRQIAKAPEKWRELNPLLPEHPGMGDVNKYFLLTGLAHMAIANYLPKDKRELFQKITIGVEAGVVGHNYYVGIRF